MTVWATSCADNFFAVFRAAGLRRQGGLTAYGTATVSPPARLASDSSSGVGPTA